MTPNPASRTLWLRRAATMLAVGALAACQTGGTGSPVPPPPSAACVVVQDSPRASVTFALPQAADAAHAPVPRNASERTIFRQLYQTLVALDCEGRVRPAIAASWSADDSGRVWHFRLNRAARFWDGTPVTAHAVSDSWTANLAGAAATFAAVNPIDEGSLRVELHSPTHDPHIFAHPDLAVARRTTTGWPVGTGNFAVTPTGDPRVLRLVRRDEAQVLEFRTFEGIDARTALDAGVDLLVASDAAALEYARALANYSAVPLRWNQIYGIATRAPASGAPATRQPPADVLTELARDAVRADARPSEPPFWFQNAECLNQSLGTASATNARGRTIAYPRNDAIARAIAERIVALAWPRPRSPLWLRELLPVDYASAGAPSVVGLPENALPDSLQAGHGLAYVLALPRIDAEVCAIAVVADPAARVIANSPGLRFTPLLDTRSYLIHRPGIGRVLLDGDGTLRFAGGGS